MDFPSSNLASLNIAFTCEDPRWNTLVFKVEEKAFQVLSQAHKDICPWLEAEVSLLLTHDQHSQLLNRVYRQKDQPTNILSFSFLTAPLTPKTPLGPLPFLLGDLVLSFDTLVKESHDEGKSFKDHFAHLLVHGFLHLLTYDHENDEKAEEMENLEIKILSHLDIKNPYI